MEVPLPKARSKVSFEDVSVYFTRAEWKLLTLRQKALYRQVMLHNYYHLVALGLTSSKPNLIAWLERNDHPWLVPEGTEGGTEHTDDEQQSTPQVSTHTADPKELQETDRPSGSQSQPAGQPERALPPGGKGVDTPGPGSVRAAAGSETSPGSPPGEGGENVQKSSSKRKPRPKRTDRQFLCEQCGKRFNRSSNLIKHWVIHSNEKPYKCSECGKLFRRSSALLEHKRIHSGEKPYGCAQCGKTFTRSSNLIKHQIIHSGEKPYQCLECGKLFRRSFALLEHQRVHSGERPYTCSECGKDFSRSSNLIEHRRIHSVKKPYVCDQCPKAFKGISQLIHHQYVHRGEKAFSCQECGKAFRGRSGLSQHRRVHNGAEPFPCSHCGKNFSRRANLLKHQRLHNKEQPSQS